MPFESPPLWVWGVIAEKILADKLIYICNKTAGKGKRKKSRTIWPGTDGTLEQ